MAKEIRVRKRDGVLMPYRVHDSILLEELPDEKEMKAVITVPRSIPHNSKYWVLLGMIVKRTGCFPSDQVMHDGIKEKLGYSTEYEWPDGTKFKSEGSTKFERMDQEPFELYYKQAIQLILTDLVPHLNDDELEREIVSF